MLVWQDVFRDGVLTRKRKRVKLARATMPEREVLKEAAKHLEPLNQGLESIGSATNFAFYVKNTYTTDHLPLMAKSTQDRYGGIIRSYLMPAFGEKCLRDLTPKTLQHYFTGLVSSPLSYESKDKIRDVLASILKTAVPDLLARSPMENVKMPPQKRGKRRNKPYITPEQFEALVELIAEPYATMVYAAVYTGLRISELAALRWNDLLDDQLTVDERYCRGDWGAPKSEASNATIAVNAAVIERIHRLKTLTVEVKAGRATRHYKVVKATGPDDLVFQSLRTGQAMRDNNILVRHIKPAARKIGLPFVNWLCLRRSHATWLKMAGADVKDAQAQMRHSRASTTLDIYQQFTPESQRKAVDRLTTLTSMVH